MKRSAAASTLALDTLPGHIASVIDRLEGRGLLLRNIAPEDKRVRLLTLTRNGDKLLAAVGPGVLRAQERMLAPLPKTQRAQFMRMLRMLVDANNAHSRAPGNVAETD